MIPKPSDKHLKMSRDRIFKRMTSVHPKLELIVCRKGVLEGEKDEVIAYIDGLEEYAPTLQLRLDNLEKGEYYILYSPDFVPN